MVPHIQSYAWQCTDCKTCAQCHDPADEDKMLFCDMCDRGWVAYTWKLAIRCTYYITNITYYITHIILLIRLQHRNALMSVLLKRKKKTVYILIKYELNMNCNIYKYLRYRTAN